MREVINMTQEADYRQAYETLDSALRQAIRLLSQARLQTALRIKIDNGTLTAEDDTGLEAEIADFLREQEASGIRMVGEAEAEAIRASEFGNLLSSDNYPSADDGFSIAEKTVTQEDIEWDKEFASNHAGAPYEAGTPIYTWHLSDTIDDVYIPLPARLSLPGGEG